MPSSCCVVGCTNRAHRGESPLGFFRVPRKPPRRGLWLSKINRKPDWNPKVGTRICGAHFVSGRPSPWEDNPDYVPTIFPKRRAAAFSMTLRQEQSLAKIKKSRPVTAAEGCSKVTTSAAEILFTFASRFENQATDQRMKTPEPVKAKTAHSIPKEENEILYDEIQSFLNDVQQPEDPGVQQPQASDSGLKDKTDQSNFRFDSLKSDPEMLEFFTGVYTAAIFMWMLDNMREKVTYIDTQLGMEDHLLIVLMKLKLGLLNKDLANRFGVSSGIVTKIVTQWIPHLATVMKELIVWPDVVTVRQHIPSAYWKDFPTARCIIDFPEILIDRPSDLSTRQQTWSTCRTNNTIKYFIAMTPSGAVSFLSSGYGGSMSEKDIATKSCFFNLVQCGDEILAERNFPIRCELAIRGATLKIPLYSTTGKTKLSEGLVEQSRKLCQARVHVEKLLGKLKSFQILQKSIPGSEISLLDDYVMVIAGLINLSPVHEAVRVEVPGQSEIVRVCIREKNR
ncbi:uncharacterized protein LOC117296645 [Asterias rubens]|uniref:uncharacterized protein LOC117296645 n=1 Tax=Asterias rubens TaxID=7604 RepID=UPI0014552CC9|nr:uncharacterized protein LOC117296645 [Asterias rubens]